MNRRHYLLSILANNGKWLPYSFEYLYHDLIPTTLPKNIFDGELEIGSLSSGQPSTSSQFIRSVNFIPVQSGTSYTITTDITPFSRFYFEQYDADKTFISETSSTTGTTTLGNTTKYIKFLIYGGGSNYSSVPINNTYVSVSNVSVNVKNKLKLATIYGNSVVENQLVQNGNFEDNSGINIAESAYGSFSVANNTCTFTLLQNISSGLEISFSSTLSIVNHKYLVRAKIKSSVGNNVVRLGYYVGRSASSSEFVGETINEGTTKYICGIITCANVVSAIRIRIHGSTSAGNQIEIQELQSTDITQRYPFDTPTTLTDNRVQAILNRGYIPYNTGEIKSVDIGEFSSEPYNLLSLDRIEGTISGSSNTTPRQFDEGKYYVGLADNNYYNSSQASLQSISENSITLTGNGGYGVCLPIRVYGGLRYTLSFELTSGTQASSYISWYDKNGNYIGQNYQANSNTITATAPQNAYWGVAPLRPNGQATYTNICFHLTGTRTGYAPHTQPQTISFKYQGGGVGTSHNSMTIYNDRVEFTKNIGVVDLGTLNWVALSGGYYANNLTVKYIGNVSSISNVLCQKYQTLSLVDLTNGTLGLSVRGDGTIWIKDSAYIDVATFKTAMSGVMLEYQLATPQVITIPRKHLGVVDLGSLSWNYSSGRFYAYPNNIKPTPDNITIPNVFCSKYLTSNWDNKGEGKVSVHTTSMIVIYDSSYGTDYNAFKNAMAGQYLFYETADEVADIIDTIGVEAGGTFTANWFSWVENQIFNSYLSPNPTIQNDLTFTRNTSTQSITINGTASAFTQRGFGGSNQLTANRYYLVYCDKPNGAFNLIDGNGSFQNDFKAGKIAHPTSNINFSPRFEINNGTSFDNLEVNIMLIDLTLAFGSGNEPTSIDDPRIQYIINLGYISTNTTGTLKSVGCEVLPNVDTKIKAK